MQSIQQQEMAGDMIAVYAPLKDPRLTVNYYYKGDATVHPIGPLAGNVNDTAVQKVLSNLPQLEDSQRLWIVFRNLNGNREANQLVAKGIEATYTVVSEERFPGPINRLFGKPCLISSLNVGNPSWLSKLAYPTQGKQAIKDYYGSAIQFTLNQSAATYCDIGEASCLV